MNLTRRHFLQAASLALIQGHTRSEAAGPALLASIEKVVLPAPPVKGGT